MLAKKKPTHSGKPRQTWHLDKQGLPWTEESWKQHSTLLTPVLYLRRVAGSEWGRVRGLDIFSEVGGARYRKHILGLPFSWSLYGKPRLRADMLLFNNFAVDPWLSSLCSFSYFRYIGSKSLKDLESLANATQSETVEDGKSFGSPEEIIRKEKSCCMDLLLRFQRLLFAFSLKHKNGKPYEAIFSCDNRFFNSTFKHILF